MFNIKIDTAVIDNSPEIKRMSTEALQVVLNEIGWAAEGYAKLLAPVDTGRLRGSITFATRSKHSDGEPKAKEGDTRLRGEAEKDAVYVGTNVEYALYQELGTQKIAGKHYLRKSIEDHINEYRELTKKVYTRYNNGST